MRTGYHPIRRALEGEGGSTTPASPGGPGAPLALPAGAGERLELLQARAEEWRPRRWVLRREVGRGGSGFVAGRRRWAGLGGSPGPPGPLLTCLHTVYTQHSFVPLTTLLNPLAEATPSPQVVTWLA